MIFDKLKADEKKELISDKEFVPKKEYNKLKRLIKTHQYYIDNIYSLYTFNPTPFASQINNLSFEFIKLFDKICKKHDLKYWMDGYTLLDSLRYDKSMPWKDTIQIGMLRKNLIKLSNILPKELDNISLENINYSYAVNADSNEIMRIYFKCLKLNKKLITINILPYDYIKDDEKNLKNNPNYMDNIEDYTKHLYSNSNLSFDNQEFITLASENKIIKTNYIFPLDDLKFNEFTLSIPNNYHEYLKFHYGKNYLQELGSIYDSEKLNEYKKHPNGIKLIEEYTDIVKKANEYYE